MLNVAFVVLERIGRMFYVIDYRTTVFSKLDDVPDYITEAVPFFVASILLESFIMYFSHELRPSRVNDGLGSVSAGLFQQVLNKILFKSLEIDAYLWVYSRFCVYDMDPTSLACWALGFVLIDLGYYWFHRMAHEVNIFWASHVVHHSSQEYNQTTALRQSALQTYFSFIFYLPFAVILPPPIFLVHRQFNVRHGR